MFLLKALLAPVLLPISLSFSALRLVVGTVIRTLLFALVAFAIMGHATRDTSGRTLFDHGIDRLREQALAIDGATIITASSAWYDWAKEHLPALTASGCPETRRI